MIKIHKKPETIINLKQLSHVIAVADTLSFSQAARQVHLSQSALSKSISSLEAEIGILIFDRNTSKVEITPAGEHVISHARHLLSEATNFSKNLEYLKTGAMGHISVGAGPFPAITFLDTGIRAFHQQHPRVSLNLRIDNWGNLLTELHAGNLDFFIADIRDLEDDARLDITPVGGLTLTLCCDHKHPLLADGPDRPIAPRELLQYTLATVRLPNMMFLELKHSMGLGRDETFATQIQCDNVTLLHRLIPDSDIILVTLNRVMDGLRRHPNIVRLNVPMTRNRFGEWALVQIRGRTLTPSAALLADQLTTQFRAGALADDTRYGFKDNSPLNFMAQRDPFS